MAHKFTLHKTERLKSRKSIERVFSAGSNFFIYPFKVQYLSIIPSDNNTPILQAGVTVSTRNFKKAVDRNRIKRITREAYRVQKNELQQILKTKQKAMQIFFIYVGKEIPVFTQLHQKLSLILERLIQKADEESATIT